MINIHILIEITPRDTALIYLKNLRIRHSILITKSFRQQEMSMGQGKFVKYINNQLIYLRIENFFALTVFFRHIHYLLGILKLGSGME